MTTDISNDQVEIPEGEPAADAGPASAPRKQGMKTSTKIALLGGAGLLAVAIGLSFSGETVTQGSDVARPPNMDSTPGGAVQAENERFQDALRQSNDQRAERAAELGVTFLPTPETVLAPLAPVEAEAEPEVEAIPAPGAEEPAAVEVTRRPIAPPPPVVRPAETAPQVTPIPVAAPAPAAPAQAEEKENPYTQNILGQMGAVTESLKLPVSAVVMNEQDETDEAATAGAAPAATPALDGASVDPSLTEGNPLLGGSAAISGEDLLIRPGDVIYGETLTNVNSDAPSPILVEVTAGELKGARLVGEFTVPQGDDRMVVSFSSMTLEDGTTVGINAFAVDGRSAETAVASDVERRYVARYGTLFAATFLSAMAAAAATPGQEVVGDTENVVTDPATREQAAWAGVAAGTEAIAADVQNFMPKGPLITLRDGFPLGILFIEPVENLD